MPAPPLHEVQRLFWRSIAEQPRLHAFAPEFLATVEGRGDSDRRERAEVYADAYFWRLRDVLAEDFPRVAAVLGPHRFDHLVQDYLRSYPSEHPSVRYVGRAIPEFIAKRPGMPRGLADLARLEWARIEVFDATDTEPATAKIMRAVAAKDWPALRLYPIPALRIIRSEWPVHKVWAGANPDTLTPAFTSIRIWRGPDYRVSHSPMDTREANALARMLAGEPFVGICEAFADLPPADAAREATGLLARWLEDGVIARVE